MATGWGTSKWEDQPRWCLFTIFFEKGDSIKSRAYAAPVYIESSWKGKIINGDIVTKIEIKSR